MTDEVFGLVYLAREVASHVYARAISHCINGQILDVFLDASDARMFHRQANPGPASWRGAGAPMIYHPYQDAKQSP